jgi:hypothetical protein
VAKSFVIELIDDLDGSEASETVRFGVDGTDYEIDLGQHNAEQLRAVLARFVQAGRHASSSGRRTAGARRTPLKMAVAGVEMKAVRRWADENGVSVNSRGRIKNDVVQRYLASLS